MNLAQTLPEIKIKLNGHTFKVDSLENLTEPQQFYQFKYKDLIVSLIYKSTLKNDYSFINGILCY